MRHARAFGSDPAHADVAFGSADRASTVTAVLAACVVDGQGRALSEDEAWDWTLSQRLQALIAVRIASGEAAIELQAPCAQCGEAMSLGLDLHALAGEPAAPRFAWRDAHGAELSLRLPRGRDLQCWVRGGVQSHEALAASLIEAVDGRPPNADDVPQAEALPALDDAFEAHDPLTALRLQARCPACAHDNSVACDLEAVLVAGLARTQAALLDEVLRLASAVHWSEQQILALPRWRRAHYLRRLDAGGWA